MLGRRLSRDTVVADEAYVELLPCARMVCLVISQKLVELRVTMCAKLKWCATAVSVQLAVVGCRCDHCVPWWGARRLVDMLVLI